MAPYLHWLVEIEHRVDAVVAVQKLWRDLTVTEIAKTMNLQECLAR